MSELAPSLYLWVVYDRPRDYPHCFVARRWEIRAGVAAPCRDCLFSPTLSELRAALPAGLTRIDPHPNDDRCILEVWL